MFLFELFVLSRFCFFIHLVTLRPWCIPYTNTPLRRALCCSVNRMYYDITTHILHLCRTMCSISNALLPIPVIDINIPLDARTRRSTFTITCQKSKMFPEKILNLKNVVHFVGQNDGPIISVAFYFSYV